MNKDYHCILLMRGHGVLSEMIRWQTRCWASHAALYIGNNMVIEAWPPKVREHRLKSWDDTYAYTNPKMKPADWARVESLVREQIGKPYDYSAVARFIAFQRDSDTRNSKWFCFELLSWALQEAGFPIGRRAPSRMDGRDFENSWDLTRTPLPKP